MNELEKSQATARLLLSTKRKNRQFSIVEIANDIQLLRNSLGDLTAVSKVIGISSGMLNQFLSVFKLPENIQQLILERKIDSVAIVNYLSKFPKEDAQKLVGPIITSELSSQDLRILLPYRKRHPEEDILQLLHRIHSSKNIKVSVIRVHKNDVTKSIEELVEIIKEQVGIDHFVSIESADTNVDIKISKEGEKILRNNARLKKKTLQEFIISLIN